MWNKGFAPAARDLIFTLPAPPPRDHPPTDKGVWTHFGLMIRAMFLLAELNEPLCRACEP